MTVDTTLNLCIPLRRCPACGAELPVILPDVCVCGTELPRFSRSPIEETDDELSADQIDASEPSYAHVEHAARRALGAGWVLGETWLVHGPAGSGKSRSVLRWATTTGADCYCLTLEMAPALCRSVAVQCGADLRRLFLSDKWRGWEKRIGRRRRLVVDSVNMVDDPRDFAESVHEWTNCTGAVAWLIARETRRGDARGGSDLDHAADGVMRVTAGPEPGTALCTVHKRRLAPILGAATIALGAPPSPSADGPAR
jgi:predicted ATP-dependent serine protease